MKFKSDSFRLFVLCLLFTWFTVSTGYGQAYDWLQFGGSAANDSYNKFENIITTENAGDLELYWASNAGGSASSSAVYATNVGGKDLIIVHAGNTVRAFDPFEKEQVWSTDVGGGGMSSPFVDSKKEFVYTIASEHLHKIDITNGNQITEGPWPVQSSTRNSRGLSSHIAKNGVEYANACASYGDRPNRYVRTINLSSGEYNTIGFGGPQAWGAACATYDPISDRLFNAMGSNEQADPGTGHTVFGYNADGSSPNAGLPANSFRTQFEPGGVNPIILPDGISPKYDRLLVQGGRDTRIYIFDLDNISDGPIWDAEYPQGFGRQGGGNQPAMWVDEEDEIYLYFPSKDGIGAMKVSLDGNDDPMLTTVWEKGGDVTSIHAANGVILYRNGATLYAVHYKSGEVLWSQGMPGSGKWDAPIIANGFVIYTHNGVRLYTVNGDIPEKQDPVNIIAPPKKENRVKAEFVSGSKKIKFSVNLDKPGNIRVYIYNSKGKRLAWMENPNGAKGINLVEWIASKTASGEVFHYSVRIDDSKSYTGKIIKH